MRTMMVVVAVVVAVLSPTMGGSTVTTVAATSSCGSDAQCAERDRNVAAGHGIRLAFDSADPLVTPLFSVLDDGGMRVWCESRPMMDTVDGLACVDVQRV